ncbi:hypothetical protein PKOR_19895 [Pontibacter korlensis]|uniref:Uncharacterized protein n=1 Tax=Pontibacter korlensis TaxID=400092 RepID=A0A0E3ZIZ3_9BACT|nr:hypothetical protein [Pontibacter korlensis]AKD04939.1 hypothetical protein PKOR_19895 [Pontibacter korlensis]
MEYNTGRNDSFYWFETHEISLGQLVKELPELFLQKHPVSLYFDGAPVKLESVEVIDSRALNKIPTDNHDQWILTKEKSQITNTTDFVNFTYFSLVDWDTEINTLQSDDDRKFIELYFNERKKLKEQFWKEIEEINPFNFISDGSKLIFVTRDKGEVEKIRNTFANQVQP